MAPAEKSLDLTGTRVVEVFLSWHAPPFSVWLTEEGGDVEGPLVDAEKRQEGTRR